MGLILQENDLVFLDTSPFIYFLERHPDLFQYMEFLFNQVYDKNALVITSVVTLIEICTLPARLNNQSLVSQYRDYFTKSKNIILYPVYLAVAEQAIALRAKYQLKTPDAILLGTAVACKVSYIVTNDRQWKQLTNQTVLTVEEIGLSE